ncbi:GntR family transcriptional regulator [Oceanobacillus sojae]|uniref:GntR family transcriptional regulator n=1 Tax=Oceanobacillus sojae TaxID=582851 RepID=A0A511ZEC1_9BACI|nr:GntR family transcriptional regulator [Oceanobacillus sojae]GEN85797.1 GntR family transcriptional regulator [Oceanobacillus sojae]
MSFPIHRLPSSSKGEEVANFIRFEIISGKFQTGDKISENFIASTYNTSRSPAREALRILQYEGLVSLERMGAVVHGMTREDLQEINDLRLLLEGFCMKKCAKEGDESLFALLNFLLEQMKISAKKNDLVEYSLHDIAFHEAIIEASKHKRFMNVWKGIKNIVVTTLLIATEKRMEMAEEEAEFLVKKYEDVKHEDIVETMQKKDMEGIDRTLRIHFEDTRKTVLDILFK